MTGRPPIINLVRAQEDFPYYASKLLRIKDKDSQLRPLDLWEPQIRLHRTLEDLRLKGKLQRVIVLKARQEGISTYSEARIFWNAHMRENTKNVVIAHEKESGRAIFGMCKLFLDCIPPKLKPMTKYSSRQEIVFANPDAKTSFRNPGLRSSLEVLTAGKKSVARGTTIHHLHASELASWTFPEDVIPALLPTIPKTDDSLVVYESTAKGMNNFFHEEWRAAEEGESNFHPFFLAWFDLPQYRRPFRSEEDAKAFAETLNDEEKELQGRFGVDLEQLHWRRLTLADFKGDLRSFRQEYPATPTEAFTVSGVCIFDHNKLEMMSLKCSEPEFRGDIKILGGDVARAKLIGDSRGDLRIWRRPEPDQIYVLGVDVADGGPQGDYSCIEVLRKLSAPLMAEQVAEWHGHIDPYNFAHVIEYLARLYNEALVAVEINAHGLATQQELQRTYWNLYQQEHYDRFKNQFANKIGWETTIRTKKLLVSVGSHTISDMTVLLHGRDLISECMTFVRDDTGSASASGGAHDDRVMAFLIALFTMHQAINKEPPESDLFQTIKSRADDSLQRMIDDFSIIDPEFPRLLAGSVIDEYDESWLNY